MPIWIIYALIATVFAGVTTIFAKLGLQKINADLGLCIRTGIVFFLVTLNLFAWNGQRDIANINKRTLLFLVLSGITTSLSWIFYYRAIKLGPVAYVSAIDKSSIVLTILLSVTF